MNYIVCFYIDEKNYFLSWECEESLFLLDSKGNLLFWNAVEELKKNLPSISFDDDVTYYNFNTFEYSDCEDFLNKWNIVDDLSKSIGMDFIGNDDDYTSLYSKFVYGSNIPALNTSGKKYVPKFSEEELEKIENVKKDMIKILKSAFKIE